VCRLGENRDLLF
jgi:hypothetical protein